MRAAPARPRDAAQIRVSAMSRQTQNVSLGPVMQRRELVDVVAEGARVARETGVRIDIDAVWVTALWARAQRDRPDLGGRVLERTLDHPDVRVAEFRDRFRNGVEDAAPREESHRRTVVGDRGGGFLISAAGH